MNLEKWTARISNWKRQDKFPKPLEYHVCHMHEEASEVFKVLRGINHGKPGVWQAPPIDSTQNPYSHVWYDSEGHPEGFGIELADVILVALYVASVTGVNIEEQMEIKMTYNEGNRAR